MRVTVPTASGPTTQENSELQDIVGENQELQASLLKSRRARSKRTRKFEETCVDKEADKRTMLDKLKRNRGKEQSRDSSPAPVSEESGDEEPKAKKRK